MIIRAATPYDVPEITRIHVRGWQVAYRGHMPEAYLAALKPSDRAAFWSGRVTAHDITVLVAVQSISLLGFCSLMPARDDDASSRTAEIAALYVDPDHWRSGVGGSLIRAAFAAADTRGFGEITLWVLSANSAACAFYESFGFAPDGQTKTDTRLGFPLYEERYRLLVPAGR